MMVHPTTPIAYIHDQQCIYAPGIRIYIYRIYTIRGVNILHIYVIYYITLPHTRLINVIHTRSVRRHLL